MVSAGALFRLFVSSTFGDFVAERDALQREVFPRLEAFCEQHGCRFQAIDLRWGVSLEAGLNQRTVRICLGEIARCQAVTPRPNFLILLGDRYGWEPLPEEIPSDEFERLRSGVADSVDRDLLDAWYLPDANGIPPVHYLRPRRLVLGAATAPEEEAGIRAAEQEAWEAVERNLRRIIRGSRPLSSISEMEIRHGALAVGDAEEHVCCLTREIVNVGEAPAEFVDRDPEARQRLASLKHELVNHLGRDRVMRHQARWTGSSLSTDHLAELCEAAFRSLSDVIGRQIEQLEAVDPLVQEREAHVAFSSRVVEAGAFVGRTSMLGRLEAAIRSPDSRLRVVHGPAGAGKSSVIAEAARRSSQWLPGSRSVIRHVGATARSTSLASFLTDLVREVAGLYDDPRPIPADPFGLVSRFRDGLDRASPDRPIVIVVDDVHLIAPVEGMDWASWIPKALPSSVALIVSVPADRVEGLSFGWANADLHALQPLSSMEAQQLLRRWLESARRRLQPSQEAAVLENRDGSFWPLSLRAVFQEAVRWRSHEAVGDLGDLNDVFTRVLVRLEAPDAHGTTLVRRALGYMAASRFGLADDEMLTVLSADDLVMSDVRDRSARQWSNIAKLPIVLWSRLFHEIEPYLVERLAGGRAILGIRNEAFRTAILQRYAGESAEGDALHRGLASTFQRAADPTENATWTGTSSRGFNELPYHLERSARLGAPDAVAGLFALSLDDRFRERQFDVLESIDPLLECLGYGLNLAIDRGDEAAILRHAVARRRMVGLINRTFLIRVADLVEQKPTLARTVIDLIPTVGDRAAALAFAAWIVGQTEATRPRCRALLLEIGATPELTVSLMWVQAVVQMSVDLLDAGLTEAVALASLIPGCPQRDCLTTCWAQWPDGRGALARAFASSGPRRVVADRERSLVGAASRQTVLETARGRYNARGIFTPGIARVEEQMSHEFGESGGAMFYALFAARELMIGRVPDARATMSRALDLSQLRPRDEQAVFVELAMTQALRTARRPILAEEYRDRVATYVGQVFAMFHSPDSLAVHVTLFQAIEPFYKGAAAVGDPTLRLARVRMAAQTKMSQGRPPARDTLLTRGGLALMLDRSEAARAAARELALTETPLSEGEAAAQYALALAAGEPVGGRSRAPVFRVDRSGRADGRRAAAVNGKRGQGRDVSSGAAIVAWRGAGAGCRPWGERAVRGASRILARRVWTACDSVVH